MYRSHCLEDIPAGVKRWQKLGREEEAMSRIRGRIVYTNNQMNFDWHLSLRDDKAT